MAEEKSSFKGGEKILLTPGRIVLAEDVTGKGHITRSTGSEDLVFLIVPLADQRTDEEVEFSGVQTAFTVHQVEGRTPLRLSSSLERLP